MQVQQPVQEEGNLLYVVSTSAGNVLVPSTARVAIEKVHGTLTLKAYRSPMALKEGDRVFLRKEAINDLTLEDVEQSLWAQSRSYRDARTRMYVVRGADLPTETLLSHYLKQAIDDSDTRGDNPTLALWELVQGTKYAANPVPKWLNGETIFPQKDPEVLLQLAEKIGHQEMYDWARDIINDDTSKNPARILRTVHSGIMRYVAVPKGEGIGSSDVPARSEAVIHLKEYLEKVLGQRAVHAIENITLPVEVMAVRQVKDGEESELRENSLLSMYLLLRDHLGSTSQTVQVDLLNEAPVIETKVEERLEYELLDGRKHATHSILKYAETTERQEKISELESKFIRMKKDLGSPALQNGERRAFEKMIMGFTSTSDTYSAARTLEQLSKENSKRRTVKDLIAWAQKKGVRSDVLLENLELYAQDIMRQYPELESVKSDIHTERTRPYIHTVPRQIKRKIPQQEKEETKKPRTVYNPTHTLDGFFSDEKKEETPQQEEESLDSDPLPKYLELTAEAYLHFLQAGQQAVQALKMYMAGEVKKLGNERLSPQKKRSRNFWVYNVTESELSLIPYAPIISAQRDQVQRALKVLDTLESEYRQALNNFAETLADQGPEIDHILSQRATFEGLGKLYFSDERIEVPVDERFEHDQWIQEAVEFIQYRNHTIEMARKAWSTKGNDTMQKEIQEVSNDTGIDVDTFARMNRIGMSRAHLALYRTADDIAQAFQSRSVSEEQKEETQTVSVPVSVPVDVKESEPVQEPEPKNEGAIRRFFRGFGF